MGSSQVLLLEKVKESLAGRSVIFEIYPLTLPELRTGSWKDKVEDSLFQRLLSGDDISDILPSFYLDKRMTEKQQALDHCIRYGAYSAVSEDRLTHEEKIIWLKNYVAAYLERDIRDLAMVRDLEPVIKLQRYLALHTGCRINETSIASEIGVTTKTVQRYIRYFELSYQAVLLPAWSFNAGKRLAKMPKFHYLDNGVLFSVLQKQGGLTGNEFESLIVSEIYKQIATAGHPAKLYHLRSHDGLEIDLLLEMPDYYLAFEIKMSERVSSGDARNLKGLGEILNKPLKHSFILSNDPESKHFANDVSAINAAMFLG